MYTLLCTGEKGGRSERDLLSCDLIYKSGTLKAALLKIKKVCSRPKALLGLAASSGKNEQVISLHTSQYTASKFMLPCILQGLELESFSKRSLKAAAYNM